MGKRLCRAIEAVLLLVLIGVVVLVTLALVAQADGGPPAVTMVDVRAVSQVNVVPAVAILALVVLLTAALLRRH